MSVRGGFVRMKAHAIPQRSRAATGFRLQKLDSGDRLAEVVLVPPAPDEDDTLEGIDSAEATQDEPQA